MVDSVEENLRDSLQKINEASFSKTSLKTLELISKQAKIVLLSNVSDWDEKKLAGEVYSKLLNKLIDFYQKISNKQITPQNDELNPLKEILSTIYNTNKELFNAYPNDNDIKELEKLQPIISSSITIIQQKIDKINTPTGPNQNTPPKPNNNKEPSNFWRNAFLILLLISVILLLIYLQKKKKHS